MSGNRYIASNGWRLGESSTGSGIVYNLDADGKNAEVFVQITADCLTNNQMKDMQVCIKNALNVKYTKGGYVI